MSTQPKYTRGPWRKTLTTRGYEIAGAEPGYVATTRGSFAVKDADEEEGNANLITAAPTILEAAEALLARIENMTTEEFSRGEEKAEREAMRAAIALAHGDAPKACTTRAKNRA